MIENSIIPRDSRRYNLGRLGKIYAATYYANAMFGLTQAWIRRKRKETPEEITNILSKLIN